MIIEQARNNNPVAATGRHKRLSWSTVALLPGEHQADFQALVDAIRRDIQADGIMEEVYVQNIARLVWETVRLLRCRTLILKESYGKALQGILEHLLRRKHAKYPGLIAEKLAPNWFFEDGAREEAQKLLTEFNMDESDVVTEAVRRSLDDLERVDKLLRDNELRRDKALASIVAFRAHFAKDLRSSSDRLIEAEAKKAMLPAPSASIAPE
jgi:hypothetical protein